jgi:hypothetical protein
MENKDRKKLREKIINLKNIILRSGALLKLGQYHITGANPGSLTILLGISPIKLSKKKGSNGIGSQDYKV